MLALFTGVPFFAWISLFLALGGGYTKYELMTLQSSVETARTATAQESFRQSEVKRAKEKLGEEVNAKLFNDLAAAKTARDAAVRDSAKRLRELAEATRLRDTATGACRDYAGPAVAVLPDAARENLIGLAASCEEVAGHLRGLQTWARNAVLTCGDAKQ